MMDQSRPTQTAQFGPNQSRVFTSPARYIVAMGGVRGGKTTVGAYWAYSQATTMRKEMTPRGLIDTAPSGIICAPIYDTLRDATLGRFFEEFPTLKRYYKEYHREMNIPIYKEGGVTHYSKIFTRSLEEAINISGRKAWWIWMDEGDGAPEEAFELAKQRISDHEDGKILITSTIYRNSWINRKIYQPMLSGTLDRADIITWPSNERPGYPQEEWERTKKDTDPIVFAREYESKFVFESGLVYGDMLRYGVIDKVPEGVKILAYFFGLDYGLDHPTVILTVGYGSDHNWYILHENHQSMLSVDQINDLFVANLSLFKGQYGSPFATFYDPAGGVAALSIMQDVFPIAAEKDIAATVTLVRNFIYQKRVYVLSHNTNTLKELSLYSFDPSKHVPVDTYNHCMDALGYAIYNGWPHVDGMELKPEPPPKNRVTTDLEARGILKDGVFQNIFESEDFLIM